MYRVGILTVPERREIRQVIIDYFTSKGIECDLFEDVEHKGIVWNFNRMVEYYTHNHTDKNIIITDDDVIFKEEYLDVITEALEKTDYKVLCTFTNKNGKPNDVLNIRKATSPYFFYEIGAVFRQGVFNEEFYKEWEEYKKQPNRNAKELNHTDNMMSSFLFNNSDKYKCGTIRPNYLTLQNVKSTLGHSIRDREQHKTEYVFGVITVPERMKYVEDIKKELYKHGFKDKDIYVFVDEEHNGHLWNYTRMIEYFATNEDKFNDKNIFLAMDDVEFKEGWFEKYTTSLNNSNYDLITGFTNKPLNEKITSKQTFNNFELYDVSNTSYYFDMCVLFRKGYWNKVKQNLLTFYRSVSNKKGEQNNGDILLNNFLNYNNARMGLIVKNAVSSLQIKSICKHNIIINKDL